MSLTVPRAGLQAGRSASIRINEPQIGNAVEQFGDVMREVGGALEAERLDRTRARERLALTQTMEDLSLQAEQIGDPDELETVWKTRIEAERAAFIERQPPELRPQAELEFDARVQPYTINKGRRQLGLMNDQRMATHTETRATLLRQAAAMDPEGRAALFSQYDTELAGLVQRGLTPADRAEADRQAFRSEAENAAALRLLDTDPAALGAALTKGLFPNLDPTQTESLRSRGAAAVQAEAARQATAAKAARKEQIGAITDELKNATGVVGLGRVYSGADKLDAAIAADPEIAALPEAQAYVRATFLQTEMPGFRASPLKEKLAIREGLAATPIDTPDANKILAAVDEDIARHREAASKDIWSYVEGLGITEAAPLPAFTAGAEADYAAALKARSRKATFLTEEGWTEGAAPVLRPQEAADLAAKANRAASPADRLAVAKVLSVLPAEQAKEVARQIKADGTFKILSGGVGAGVLDDTLVRETFEGLRMIAADELALPPKAELHGYLAETYGGIFAKGTGPGQADQREQAEGFTEAAIARYAFLKAGSSARTDKTLDMALLDQAASEIAGGTPDGKGGIQTVRGTRLVLPPGMTAADFEGGLDLIGSAIASNSMLPSDWQMLSPKGQIPLVAGQPLTENTMASVFVAARADGYVLEYLPPDSDYPVIVKDEAGNPFVMDRAQFAKLSAARDQRLKEYLDRQPAAVAAREEKKVEAEERVERAHKSTETVTNRQKELEARRAREAYDREVRTLRSEQPSLDRAQAERMVNIRRLAKERGISVKDAAREYDQAAKPQQGGDR